MPRWSVPRNTTPLAQRPTSFTLFWSVTARYSPRSSAMVSPLLAAASA
ncbi:MAG: hypothetical protein U0235_06655 [Polyangiaceae bacterium]